MAPQGASSAREVQPTSRQQAARGSQTARGFEAFTHDVYGWAYRLLGHHHDALDVVQDVFLKWDRQCADQTPEQPRGWLRRVTINRAIDCRRGRHERERLSADSAAGGIGLRDHSDDTLDAPGEGVDRETLRDDISASLEGLTDVQRAVLIAKVYDEMTFRQIATELGSAIPTVKTHYLRAVRAVRDRLQPRWAREDA